MPVASFARNEKLYGARRQFPQQKMMRLGRARASCQLLFFALVYIGAAVSKEGIDTHLAVVVGEVRRMTLCDNGRLPDNCEPAWRAREERWRSQYIAGERSRLQTHARLWGDFLPFSRAPVQEVRSCTIPPPDLKCTP